MKKAKTELLRTIQKELNAETKNGQNSRREFLQTTAKASLIFTLQPLLPRYLFTSAYKPTVAILGAGIAGLTAAHYLNKSGIHPTIYEANSFVGGRMQTAVNKINDNVTSEIGGEFIDSNHYEIRRLIKEFGLDLKDHTKDPLNTPATKETYFIDGHRYKLREVIHNFNGFAPKIQKDQKSCGENYDTPAAEALDRISISGYFNRIGINGWLRKLLEAAYMAEFGAECNQQSALNFISMISVDTRFDFNVFGESDERFGIIGGNGLLPKKMAENYKHQVELEKSLTSVRSVGRKYKLSFADGSEITADQVICTIPFSVLKDIDLKIDQLTPTKKRLISDLGYGNNAKLIMGFSERPWRLHNGAAGYLINEIIHNGWDSSNMQNNNQGAGGYTVYTSAADAIKLAKQVNEPKIAIDKFLPLLEQVYPGCQNTFNGKSLIANWPEVPTIKGAYAYYKPGQWTHIAGQEATAAGNFYFAGEHCSTAFQGYMNGGAQTGKDAALMLLQKLKR